MAKDGFSGATGGDTLNWNQVPPPAPANDAFANAQSLSGGSGSGTGTNANATKETGEPNHAANAGGHSIWYRWTAPTTDPVTIVTVRSPLKSTLFPYTTLFRSGLTTIASNDDIDGSNSRSRV